MDVTLGHGVDGAGAGRQGAGKQVCAEVGEALLVSAEVGEALLVAVEVGTQVGEVGS